MFRNKEKSNDILKYAIQLCQGRGFNCPFKNTYFTLILSLKHELEEMGAIWQIKTLNYWIHRFEREITDTSLQNPERILILKKKQGGI